MTFEKSFYATNRWFAFFICLHIAIWTLFPCYTRFNLPLDTMEGITWGSILQWGYDKDPLLNAWITRLAIEISHYHEKFIYFFSQCTVAIGFYAIWRLARKFLPPIHALIAVILLEGMQYYNIASIDFNDNVLQIMLWPLLCLAFYNACQTQKTLSWIGVGLAAGLGFLAKYYIAMLYIPLFLFLLINPNARQSFKQKGFYVGLFVFIVLILPHLVWLLKHDLLTLKYSMNQAKASHVLFDHFWQPIRFTLMQLAAFIIPLLLLSTLLGREKGKKPALTLNKNDWQYLLFIGFGPLIANILYAAITGNSIHVLWGMPLLSFWGIIIVILLYPLILPHQFLRFFITTFLLMIAAGIAYHYSLSTAGNTSSANYPGKNIAKKITQHWKSQSERPFTYIAGPRWLAGNIAFYSPEHPLVYMEWNPIVNPEIHTQDIKEKGAIFVWEIDDKGNIPSELLQQFPQIKILPQECFKWHRSQKTFDIGIGILLPQKETL